MGWISYERWIWNQVSSFLSCFGELVPEEQEEERKSECDRCEYKGKVKPDGLKIETDGCTLCGCPFATKRRQKTLLRKKGMAGKPLTKKEIAFIAQYKDTERVEQITITCPHTEGNKWEHVDSKYE